MEELLFSIVASGYFPLALPFFYRSFIMKNFFNVKDNVSNKDLVDSLKQSIKHNDNALDYIVNKKRVVNDLYLYTEAEDVKEELQNLEYIEFVLKYVGQQYSDNLARL